MADDQRFFFLDLKPAGVDGGCTKQGHERWLELDSWNFNMNQTAEPNDKGGRPTNTSSSGSFSFQIKYNDPALFANCSSGNLITQAITFEAERGGLVQPGSAGSAGQKTTGTYFRLVFTGVVIHAWALGGDSGQKTEDCSFSFEEIEMTYRPVVNGVLGAAVTRKYDTKSLIATAS